MEPMPVLDPDYPATSRRSRWPTAILYTAAVLGYIAALAFMAWGYLALTHQEPSWSFGQDTWSPAMDARRVS